MSSAVSDSLPDTKLFYITSKMILFKGTLHLLMLTWTDFYTNVSFFAFHSSQSLFTQKGQRATVLCTKIRTEQFLRLDRRFSAMY